jgi:hypothetical protein
MARISVEQVALTDCRYQSLGRIYHKDRHWALGRMLCVWNTCQEHETYQLTRDELRDIHPDLKGFAEALVAASLGRAQEDGTVYICGTRGRIEWLSKSREHGKLGGKYGALGGRPKKTPDGVIEKPPVGLSEKPPPSPSPSPSPSPAQETPPTPSRKRSGKGVESYPAEFESFWQAYPKHIAKAEAFKAWKKAGIKNGLYEAVMVALEAQKKSQAWAEDGGKFIPYAQKWLNQRRWEDEVFRGKPAPSQAGGSDSMQAQLRAIQDRSIMGGEK